MKVLHILSSDKYSGAENVACQIISKMKKYDIDAVYCSVEGEIRSSVEERRIEFVSMSRLSVVELRKVIKQQKPDIIHAHDMKASLLAAICCKNIPLISHIHNNSDGQQKITLKSVLYRYAAKKAKSIIWVSESAYKGYYFHEIYEKKSIVLYNAIDENELNNKILEDFKEYRYDLVYLGRLSYPKNPQRLIRVCKMVSERIKDCRIAIVGTGEYEEEIKGLVKELGLENNIKFFGYMNNPYKLLANAKTMIMTSRMEGTPMCILEAMALGVPVVSTPVGGICKLVEDGRSGYLCDTDEELAEKIIEIISNNELQEYLSENTKKRYKLINSMENYEKVIYQTYTKAL